MFFKSGQVSGFESVVFAQSETEFDIRPREDISGFPLQVCIIHVVTCCRYSTPFSLFKKVHMLLPMQRKLLCVLGYEGIVA